MTSRKRPPSVGTLFWLSVVTLGIYGICYRARRWREIFDELTDIREELSKIQEQGLIAGRYLTCSDCWNRLLISWRSALVSRSSIADAMIPDNSEFGLKSVRRSHSIVF